MAKNRICPQCLVGAFHICEMGYGVHGEVINNLRFHYGPIWLKVENFQERLVKIAYTEFQ
jgi:hypothetical protein